MINTLQAEYKPFINDVMKLIDIYETKGILAFCGYIKMIVFTNCFAEGAQTYKAIRKFSRDFTVSCDEKMWNDIIDKYDPDTMQYYKFNKRRQLWI